jgi:hypothetical protein
MTIVDKVLIGAVVLQVVVTFAILLILGRERVPLVTSGEVRMGDIAVSREGWPIKARQLANSFDNQFQLPVLLYVGTLLTLWAGSADWVLAILAWLFVILRVVHAAIHGSDNDVPRRFIVYVAGMVVLMAFWLWLAVKLLILTPGAA